MPIIVKQEPKELSETGILEKCVFCAEPTVYWHEESNNPVCQDCASKNEVEDIPGVDVCPKCGYVFK